MLKTIYDILFGRDRGMTRREFRKMTERSRLSDYLPWDDYDEQSRRYYIPADKMSGFAWECLPVCFAGEKTVQTLEGIFRAGLPFGSIVQFILYSDKFIDPFLNGFERLRVRKNPLVERSTAEICRFLKRGTEGLDSIAGIPVRNYRLFVTLKMPDPKDGQAVNFHDIYSHYTEVLNGADLHPKPLSPQELVDWMARFFNDREFPGAAAVPYDETKPIAKQVLLSETITGEEWEHMKVGGKYFRCVTPRAFPKPKTGVYPMQTNRLFGGVMGVVDDQNQVKTPYLYTLNIVFHNLKNKLRMKSSVVMNQQAAGSFVRPLARKKDEFAEISDLVESGETFVRVIPILWTWSESPTLVRDSVSRIKRLWESQGYTMQEDRGVIKPLFLAALPFGLYDIENNIENLERDFPTPADRVPVILPVQADFAGGGDPVLLWIGRKGQLGTLDFFNRWTTNYNGAIFAGSGGGKSFLSNVTMNNYFARGDIIRVCDIGGSYKKQSRMSGARYMDFTEGSDICINPFSTINDIRDDLSVIADIVLQMIYSSTSNVPKDIAETSMTAVKNAILWAFSDSGPEAEVNHVYRYLRTFPEHARDFSDEEGLSGAAMENIRTMCHTMAYNLAEFTTLCKGIYGRWFNGRSNFNIRNDEFVVLELDHLLAKRELFRVVILQVLNAISQDLYGSSRDRRRFGFFDEAAQYLKAEGLGGGFSPIINMVDAAFRRARKYKGSFWVILQSVLDLQVLGSLGRVIDANAAYKLYLKSVDFEKARSEKLIDCDDFELDLMKSLTTVPGKYSEIFVSSPVGKGVARLVVDPFNYLVNTSTPEEVALLDSLVEKGLTYEEAIDAYLSAK
jgi:conjugal transfer ATP-binding protein TraC